MEKMKKIYLLRNKIDGMEYIGQTKQDLKRRLWHGYNPDTLIQQAIDRDGLENFDKEILEEGLTQEEANEKEQYYIRTRNTLWPNGYNLQSGGKHFKKHPLTSQKTSETMMGHSVSIETREKISQKKKGVPFSQEHREHIGEARRGKHLPSFSDEHKQKLSESQINDPNKSKSVKQYRLDGQFVKEYTSLHEASRRTGVDASSISKCCSGKNKTAGNYLWSF